MIKTNVAKQELVDKAVELFDEGYACSQSVLLSYAPYFNLDEQTAKLISSTFGGGMGRLRQTCGAVTGGFMVLGMAFGNEDPKDMDKKLDAYHKVRTLNKMVIDIHSTSNCKELLVKHATGAEVEDRQHHKIICRKVVANVTALVYDILSGKEEFTANFSPETLVN